VVWLVEVVVEVVIAVMMMVVGSRMILQPIFDERPANWTNSKGFETRTALMQSCLPVVLMLREIRLNTPLFAGSPRRM
jgi:hypothetical protein